MFEIEDLHSSIADICTGILRNVLTIQNYTDLNDTKRISAALLEELRVKAGEWGVEFLQFNIIECAPTPETAQIILAATGVMMKAQALIDMTAKLGMPLGRLDATLAAVLVGVPLVASPGVRNAHVVRNDSATESSDQREGSFISRFFQG